MRLRVILFLTGLGLTVAASWLLPNVKRQPDRFEVALQMIESGRAGDAVYLLDDPVWRGIAEYRAERYHRALVELIKEESVLTLYNIGNAYAKVHEWQGAIAAYEKALRLDPGQKDAAHNLEVVKRARQAERELVEKQRAERKIGRWNDGKRDADRSNESEGGETVREDISQGESVSAAKEETSASGTTSGEGLLGDEQKGEESFAGNAPDDDPDAEGTADSQMAATGVVWMQESAQEAEILLNRIHDNPARVLRARFRAIHKQRSEVKE